MHALAPFAIGIVLTSPGLDLFGLAVVFNKIIDSQDIASWWVTKTSTPPNLPMP
jgi:hypothetical protein